MFEPADGHLTEDGVYVYCVATALSALCGQQGCTGVSKKVDDKIARA